MAKIQRHLIRRNSPPTPTLKSLHTNWFAESYLTWATAPRQSFPLCIGGHGPSYTRNRISSARRAAFPDFLGHDPSRRDIFPFHGSRPPYFLGLLRHVSGAMHLSQSRLHHIIHIWVIPRDYYSDLSLALSCSHPTVGRVHSETCSVTSVTGMTAQLLLSIKMAN